MNTMNTFKKIALSIAALFVIAGLVQDQALAQATLTTTTTTNAVAATDGSIVVGSTTGITAPIRTTRSARCCSWTARLCSSPTSLGAPYS